MNVAEIPLNVLLNPKKHFTLFSPSFKEQHLQYFSLVKYINILDIRFLYI